MVGEIGGEMEGVDDEEDGGDDEDEDADSLDDCRAQIRSCGSEEHVFQWFRSAYLFGTSVLQKVYPHQTQEVRLAVEVAAVSGASSLDRCRSLKVDSSVLVVD